MGDKYAHMRRPDFQADAGDDIASQPTSYLDALQEGVLARGIKGAKANPVSLPANQLALLHRTGGADKIPVQLAKSDTKDIMRHLKRDMAREQGIEEDDEQDEEEEQLGAGEDEHGIPYEDDEDQYLAGDGLPASEPEEDPDDEPVMSPPIQSRPAVPLPSPVHVNPNSLRRQSSQRSSGYQGSPESGRASSTRSTPPFAPSKVSPSQSADRQQNAHLRDAGVRRTSVRAARVEEDSRDRYKQAQKDEQDTDHEDEDFGLAQVLHGSRGIGSGLATLSGAVAAKRVSGLTDVRRTDSPSYEPRDARVRASPVARSGRRRESPLHREDTGGGSGESMVSDTRSRSSRGSGRKRESPARPKPAASQSSRKKHLDTDDNRFENLTVEEMIQMEYENEDNQEAMRKTDAQERATILAAIEAHRNKDKLTKAPTLDNTVMELQSMLDYLTGAHVPVIQSVTAVAFESVIGLLNGAQELTEYLPGNPMPDKWAAPTVEGLQQLQPQVEDVMQLRYGLQMPLTPEQMVLVNSASIVSDTGTSMMSAFGRRRGFNDEVAGTQHFSVAEANQNAMKNFKAAVDAGRLGQSQSYASVTGEQVQATVPSSFAARFGIPAIVADANTNVSSGANQPGASAARNVAVAQISDSTVVPLGSGFAGNSTQSTGSVAGAGAAVPLAVPQQQPPLSADQRAMEQRMNALENKLEKLTGVADSLVQALRQQSATVGQQSAAFARTETAIQRVQSDVSEQKSITSGLMQSTAANQEMFTKLMEAVAQTKAATEQIRQERAQARDAAELSSRMMPAAAAWAAAPAPAPLPALPLVAKPLAVARPSRAATPPPRSPEPESSPDSSFAESEVSSTGSPEAGTVDSPSSLDSSARNDVDEEAASVDGSPLPMPTGKTIPGLFSVPASSPADSENSETASRVSEADDGMTRATSVIPN